MAYGDSQGGIAVDEPCLSGVRSRGLRGDLMAKRGPRGGAQGCIAGDCLRTISARQGSGLMYGWGGRACWSRMGLDPDP